MEYDDSWAEETFFDEGMKSNDWERAPIRIKNLDTGEVYASLTEAGRKLGLLSNLKLPKNIGPGDQFEKGGFQLEFMT